MSWFYIMWIGGAVVFAVSLYGTLRALNQVINLNAVRINENRQRLEQLEEKLLKEEEEVC
jgi:hypothetical protein